MCGGSIVNHYLTVAEINARCMNKNMDVEKDGYNTKCPHRNNKNTQVNC